jgi:hypothetical protein
MRTQTTAPPGAGIDGREGADAFPRVVEHELGETTIPERPDARRRRHGTAAELRLLLALGVDRGFGKRNDRSARGSKRPEARDRVYDLAEPR